MVQHCDLFMHKGLPAGNELYLFTHTTDYQKFTIQRYAISLTYNTAGLQTYQPPRLGHLLLITSPSLTRYT